MVNPNWLVMIDHFKNVCVASHIIIDYVKYIFRIFLSNLRKHQVFSHTCLYTVALSLCRTNTGIMENSNLHSSKYFRFQKLFDLFITAHAVLTSAFSATREIQFRWGNDIILNMVSGILGRISHRLASPLLPTAPLFRVQISFLTLYLHFQKPGGSAERMDRIFPEAMPTLGLLSVTCKCYG